MVTPASYMIGSGMFARSMASYDEVTQGFPDLRKPAGYGGGGIVVRGRSNQALGSLERGIVVISAARVRSRYRVQSLHNKLGTIW